MTLPHKEAAFALCSALTPRAPRRGGQHPGLADDGGCCGDNIDGAGLMRDLTARHHLDLRRRRVFMLGAGSAARGVAPALLDAGIARMVVVNRTPERARRGAGRRDGRAGPRGGA